MDRGVGLRLDEIKALFKKLLDVSAAILLSEFCCLDGQVAVYEKING